jgi:hypothetical protein
VEAREWKWGDKMIPGTKRPYSEKFPVLTRNLSGVHKTAGFLVSMNHQLGT